MLLGDASGFCPWMNNLRNWSNPNNCGNLIEALLAIADLAPRVHHGEKDSRDLEGLFSSQRWAMEREVHGARDYVLGLSRHPLFISPVFLAPLVEVIRLTGACVFELPSRGLFANLWSRRSKRDDLDAAVADIEAVRLGWPAAAYSLPGCITTQSGDRDWVVLPVWFYPERKRELLAMTTPDVFV